MSGQVARLVITSVPRGLDGGGGIQPVSRTAGMPPAVSRRLCDLAAYSHPCSGGDPRNPAVFQHRIESIGGRRLHLLAGIRDAGASYTGRSNHLAELLVIDEEDLAGLTAGPAFAARHFPWLTRWEGEPREEPPMLAAGLPADDPEDPVLSGRTAACPRWKEATGDAGWAGELAKAFLDGRNAVIEMNASHQSIILDLFAEAAQLLPVRDRWRVTFNTSELDFFPAAWRARRLDLPLVGPRPESNDLRLVLDEIRRDGRHPNDSAFSRFARGESPPPWHTGAAAANATATEEHGQGDSRLVPAEGFADEAMVRERLARLREHRHRSAGPRAIIPPAGDARRLRRRPLVPIVAAMAMVALAAVVLTLLTTPRSNSNVRETASHEIPSEHERREAKDRDRKAKEQQAAEQADAKKAAQAEEDRRRRERNDQARKEEKKKQEAAADAKKTAAEEQAALRKRRRDAFRALSSDKTVYINVEPPPPPSLHPQGEGALEDVVLCSFDSEHLVDPVLEFACVAGSRVKPLRVDTQYGPRWPVTTEVFDTFSNRDVQRQVFDLVAEDGQLKLCWPRDREQRLTWEDPVFATLQNSLLFVFASDPDSQGVQSEPKPCRTIAFAAPIIPELLALDPLAGKREAVFKPESELVRRLEAIDPAALHWELELNHPEWRGPQRLTAPAAPKSLPDLPEAGIEITYEDVDHKDDHKDDPRVKRQRQGHLRIKATVTFAPERASLTLAPSIAGLDDLPALSSIVTLDLLRECRDKKPEECSAFLKPVLQTALDGRSQLRDREFEEFIANDQACKESDLETMERWKELEAENLRINDGPGAEYGNNPRNPKWQDLVQANQKKRRSADDINRRFAEPYARKRDQEVTAAVNSIKALAAAAAPVTIRIRSLWANTSDSTGREHRVLIVPESD